MSFSKSPFARNSQNTYRVMYNPVERILPTEDCTDLDKEDKQALTIIDKRYVGAVAKKNYESVPKDYLEYIRLYKVIRSIKYKTQNKCLLILLKIIEEALVSSINTYTIYSENVILRIDKINLEKKIEEILSDKNTVTVQMMNTSGQLNITKSFKLKGIFNYYILLYGLPAYGVGFDPERMVFLEHVMRKNGIDPYK